MTIVDCNSEPRAGDDLGTPNLSLRLRFNKANEEIQSNNKKNLGSVLI